MAHLRSCASSLLRCCALAASLALIVSRLCCAWLGLGGGVGVGFGAGAGAGVRGAGAGWGGVGWGGLRRLASPSLAAACAARSVAPAEGAGRMQRGCRGARRETRPVARRGARAGCRGGCRGGCMPGGRRAWMLRSCATACSMTLRSSPACSRQAGAAADQRRWQIRGGGRSRGRSGGKQGPSPSRPSLAAGRGTPRHTEAHRGTLRGVLPQG